MSSRDPGHIPTFAELDDVGHDASALLDAVEWTLECAEAMAANEMGRKAFAKAIKRVQRRRAEYFGGEA